MDTQYIFGKHAVLTALARRPDVIRAVLATTNLLNDAALQAKFARHTISVDVLNPHALPRGIPREAVHQGIIAEIDCDRLVMPFETFIDTLAPTPDTALAVLGEVHDPHNVGAIIRSAAAFGVAAVLLPRHRQAPITGTVARTSAGAVFSLPIVSVQNVNRSLASLKKRGFWVYGLTGDAETPLHNEHFSKPAVFVIGNEGAGIREKTREHCDTLLSIPIHQRVESVNASVAAAVTFYAWHTAHSVVRDE